MTIEEAQRIGAVCGLYTLGECYRNITMHHSMFSYKEFNTMIGKLIDEIKALPEYDDDNWEELRTPQHIIDEEDRKMQEYFEAEAEGYNIIANAYDFDV